MDRTDVVLKEKALKMQKLILESFGRKKFNIRPLIKYGVTFKYQVCGYFKGVNFIIWAEVVSEFEVGFFLKVHIIMTDDVGKSNIAPSIVGEITNTYLRRFTTLKKEGSGSICNRQMPFFLKGNMGAAEVVDVVISTRGWVKKKRKKK